MSKTNANAECLSKFISEVEVEDPTKKDCVLRMAKPTKLPTQITYNTFGGEESALAG
jgi:hypothetical protein